MADIQTHDPINPSLPKAQVLSYVTHLNTPTRVRQVAFRGVKIAGVLQLACAAVYFGLLDQNARTLLEWIISSGSWISALEIFWNWTIRMVQWSPLQLLTILTMLCMLLASPVHLFLARWVARGRRLASQLAWVSLIPLLVFCALCAFAAAAYAVSWGFSFRGLKGDPTKFIWFLPAAAMILATLLVRDLMGLLWWIAKNPSIEKPPTPFLPGNPRSTLTRSIP